MRLKIMLELEEIPLKDMASTTAKEVHKLLGVNNKWHDLERKPFTCSLIRGGKLFDRVVRYNNDAHIFINTEDNEIIDAVLVNNPTFEIIPTKVFKGYNLLSVKYVVFTVEGKKQWITEENKDRFIKHIESRYAIKVEILKLKNSVINFKNKMNLPVTDLLIKIPNSTNVLNLFNSGIGGSCSLGFGFVESIVNEEVI